jgi:hypothetical protein
LLARPYSLDFETESSSQQPQPPEIQQSWNKKDKKEKRELKTGCEKIKMEPMEINKIAYISLGRTADR